MSSGFMGSFVVCLAKSARADHRRTGLRLRVGADPVRVRVRLPSFPLFDQREDLIGVCAANDQGPSGNIEE